jgi:hypothetical protein
VLTVAAVARALAIMVGAVAVAAQDPDTAMPTTVGSFSCAIIQREEPEMRVV